MPPAEPRPHIQTFVLGEYLTNCFVVTTPGSPDEQKKCWIVDCGLRPGEMLDHIDREGLEPAAILLTHTHLDHIAGVDAALARFGPLPLYVHEAERGFCSDAMLNLSALIGQPVTCTEPEHLLKGGEKLELNGTVWRVMHAPGHSPGAVLYIHDESKQAIAGDTLFAGSMGRVDFPTSDPHAMQRSLAKIMALPDDMTIHPGHGPETTIGRERRSNPFV